MKSDATLLPPATIASSTLADRPAETADPIRRCAPSGRTVDFGQPCASRAVVRDAVLARVANEGNSRRGDSRCSTPATCSPRTEWFSPMTSAAGFGLNLRIIPSRRGAAPQRLADRHQRLLHGTQGRAVEPRPRGAHRLGHRPPGGPTSALRQERLRSSTRSSPRRRQGQPVGRMDRRRRRHLRRRLRPAGPSPHHTWIPVDRLLAVHAVTEGDDRPRRQVVRLRQDRMRAAFVSAEKILSSRATISGARSERNSWTTPPDFEHDAELLLKFHGIYQQDDRDVRRAARSSSSHSTTPAWVPHQVPGGVISSEQWLALDRVAALADHKLRLTTRQGVQYHVVHKGELRELVAGINASLLTTLGACGDVVRNVMACPLPHPERAAVIEPLPGRDRRPIPSADRELLGVVGRR